ncbi:hypothetical protein C5167_021140 [Papaver somniferum]|uniref:Uncharacterized protein n=1 Tax=Papaver somniferum TaxID=3469 RepID=A0A4Y7IY96_PAPSO|nr:transcription factor MYB36-like [Papaver somniferum]RZC52712.1 hypothetical protein C5167_021140 [Papaver somniferum]
MGRAPCCDKANMKKGPWSPEEDATLKSYIDQNGTGGNWIALPQKIGLKRCGKSCRLRWLNYLRPNIKHGGFSEEEDTIICNLYISIGSRWSIIAAQLPGRTDNDIKNYWNTKLKKKLLGRRKDSQARRLSSSIDKDLKDSNEEDNSYANTLSNSALERLQLHMQFQNLQTPLSFYNNPVLWPKLHPLGEKIFQDHQHGSNMMNINPTAESSPFIQKKPNSQDGIASHQSTTFCELSISSAELERDDSATRNPNNGNDHLGYSLEGFSSFNGANNVVDENIMNWKSNGGVEQLNTDNFQSSVFGLQAELTELLNHNKTSGFEVNENHHSRKNSTISETDYWFKEMDGNSSKDSKSWWTSTTTDFDTISSSSNSWDNSASAYHSTANDEQGMFQEYVLEYDL